MNKEHLLSMVAALFILLFIYTAVSKLTEIEKFRGIITVSPLLSSQANIVAWFVPLAELIVSALLLTPHTRKWGFLASAFLMLTFSVYVVYMILFADHLPCSCGGAIGYLSWTQHVYFNLALTLLAMTATYLEFHHKLFIAIKTGAAENLQNE